jgi:hypothetical protein
MNIISRLLVATALTIAPGSNLRLNAGQHDRLDGVQSLTCTFSLYATGMWVNGEAKAELKPSELSLRFDAINTNEGTAQVSVVESPRAPRNGGFEASHIIVQRSRGAIHLVQLWDSGPLYVTTVFEVESRPGKLKAVHARHEYISMPLPRYTSRPEQYYGECEARR